MGFTCTVCGRFHDEEPRDVRVTYPGPVARLDADERAQRVIATDDFCSYTEPGGTMRHFVRGLIEIPVPEESSYFGYGAWVELDAHQIERVASLWRDATGADAPPFEGTLANELRPYVNTEGLSAVLELREVERLPAITVSGSHRLVTDIRRGISVARARELAGAVLHRV